MNSIEKALAAAVEPLVDDIISLEKRVDAISVKDGVGIKAIEIGQDNKSADFILDNDQVVTIDLPEGPAGAPGEKGIDGKNGVGLDCPVWSERIYRQGDRVQHNIGQYFEAKADTAGEPGISDDWERLGTAGMRFCGGFKKDATYIDGDVYVKDYCTFLVVKGESKMLAKVGGKGDRGEPGKDADNELVAKYLLSSPDFSEQLKRVSNGVDDFVVNDDGFAIITRSGDVHSWTLPTALKQFLNMTSALAEDEQPPITRFVGSWDGGESYTRGDVVQYGQGVYVCYKSGKSNVLLEHFICLMTISFAGGGGGGGGVGPAGPAGPQGAPGVDGKDGIDGKSAYEIAVDGGFVGTEQQWLDSLVGADGDSAYEVAVAGGYVGTEAEWIASLKGEQGMGLRYVGRVPTAADLAAIVDPVHGDIYIAEDTGNAYVWNSVASSWDDAGPVVGAEGPIGPQGEPGPTGVSADADNGAYLGTDNLVYVPKADGVYLPLAGGTMTGILGLTGSGTQPFRFGSEPAGNYNMRMLASEGGMQWQFNSTPLFLMGKTALTAQQPLSLAADPTIPLGAATKQYVDNKFAGGGYTLPAATTTTLGGVKVGNGLSVAADGTLTAAGDYLPLTGGTMTGQINMPLTSVGAPYSFSWGGSLKPSISADDSSWYLDVGTNNAMYVEPSRVGFSLPVELKADPTQPFQAATKKYVDDKVAAGGGSTSGLPLTGGTMSGTIASPISMPMSFINSYSLFSANGGVSFRFGAADLIAFSSTAITNYKPMVTPAAGVGVQFGSGGGYFAKGGTAGVGLYAGGALRLTLDSTQHTSYVPIVLPADPTTDLQAATKAYVDSKAGGGAYLPLAGGTMSGAINMPNGKETLKWATGWNFFDNNTGLLLRSGESTLASFLPTKTIFVNQIEARGQVVMSADPKLPMETATKQYVDSKVATAAQVVSLPASGADPDASLYPNNTLLVKYTP